MRKQPEIVLFDLGGVLVELTDLSPLWFGTRAESEEELWHLWLTCGLPSQMDRGQLTVEEFCTRWQELWKLDRSVDEIRRVYEALIIGPFPGALDLVRDTARHARVGCLSNMNPCHWPVVSGFGFGALFEHEFVSHLIGQAKPDDAVFEHVVHTLDVDPGRILFLDDNRLNVDAARRHGMEAKLVRGVAEAQKTLNARLVSSRTR